jgi:hypothetical protein
MYYHSSWVLAASKQSIDQRKAEIGLLVAGKMRGILPQGEG